MQVNNSTPIPRKKTGRLRRSLLWGLLGSTAGASLVSCSVPTPPTSVDGPGVYKLSATNQITDYTNSSAITKALIGLLSSRSVHKHFNIVQLGDSHTAADIMSGAARKQLQARYGIGSIGMVEVLNIPGQGNGLVTYKSTNVSLVNSRRQKDYDYYFGGNAVILNYNGVVTYRPTQKLKNSQVSIIARCSYPTQLPEVNLGTEQGYKIKTSSSTLSSSPSTSRSTSPTSTLIKGAFPLGEIPANQGCQLEVENGVNTTSLRFQGREWVRYDLPLQGNFALANRRLELVGVAEGVGFDGSGVESVSGFESSNYPTPEHPPVAVEVGGIFITNQQLGLSYTSIGSNGATLKSISTWGPHLGQNLQHLNPHLVILAVGTNESYGSINPSSYKCEYKRLINEIRHYNPQTSILIFSNPDSLNNLYPKLKNTACSGTQHPGVDQMYNLLRQIAQENQTLFWDWRQAMGGQCSMQGAVAKGFANKDGVHFTFATYRAMGQKFAADLMDYSKWQK